MLRNYLTVALRSLRKQKGYTFINVAGLALGLASCLFILIYIQDELNYDRFHEHADRIYQAGMRGVIGGQFMEIANTSTPMGPALKADFPEVENFTRVKSMGRVLFSLGATRFYEENVFWADSTFFSVFSFPLVRGNPETALAAPNTIVLTESTARKYFGDGDPIGKTLRFANQQEYTITGLAEDLPSSSHLHFDILVSMETVLPNLNSVWLSHHLHTYLLLQPGVSAETVEGKLPTLIDQYVAPEFEAIVGTTYEEAKAGGMEFGYYMQPLTGLYLRHVGSDAIGATSDIRYVYILGAIGVFILLLACINFMNLSTARSANRAREVGLRKVLGSDRRQLIQQFMGESILIALFAFVVAGLLVVTLMPLFGALAGKTLPLTPVIFVKIMGLLLFIALISGFLAGVYPAFVLSAFQPARVIKGTLSSGSRGSWLRSGLVVVQFTVSIVLLIGTGAVFNQLSFMQNERLGFSGEQVVVVPVESQAGRNGIETFRQTLLQHAGIEAVAASDFIPGRVNNTTAFRPEDAPPTEAYVLATARVSHDYLETLDIELVAGRDFDRAMATDSTATIINESGARELGWTIEEALGKRIVEIAAGPNNEDYARTIIGIAKDFHFASLHEPIRPIAFNIDPTQFQRVSIRIRPENMPATLEFIQAGWESLEPGYPYSAVFLDADFNRFYTQENRLADLFVAFTVLAVIIACMGLFGLASFVAEQRTAEIGVRKVLGASVASLVLLLSREFSKLVILASIIAIPIGFFAMNRWMENFAYHTTLSWWLFAAAAGTGLLIAIITVSYQSIKAALVNPVDSLRHG